MVPPVSTFAANGDLDRAAFTRNIDQHLAFGMNGVLVAGSSGESALLDDDDRRELLSLARERAATTLPMSGAICQRRIQTAAATRPIISHSNMFKR